MSVARATEPGLATRSVTVRAHAKINLDLRVLGTRPDGFHELRTVFQALSLHDTIECVPRAGPFAIECETAGVPFTGKMMDGKHSTELVADIEQSSYDLVVLGVLGLGRTRDSQVGSVCSRVAAERITVSIRCSLAVMR